MKFLGITDLIIGLLFLIILTGFAVINLLESNDLIKSLVIMQSYAKNGHKRQSSETWHTPDNTVEDELLFSFQLIFTIPLSWLFPL